MANSTTGAGKVIRRLRKRLALSQEALSRMLGASKGAVQHWERGRNNPDLERLMALRQVSPPGAERRELDHLLAHRQSLSAPNGNKVDHIFRLAGWPGREAEQDAGRLTHRKEHQRQNRQLARLNERLMADERKLRDLENLLNLLCAQLEIPIPPAPRHPTVYKIETE